MHAVKDRGLDISASSNLKVFFIKNHKTQPPVLLFLVILH